MRRASARCRGRPARANICPEHQGVALHALPPRDAERLPYEEHASRVSRRKHQPRQPPRPQRAPRSMSTSVTFTDRTGNRCLVELGAPRLCPLTRCGRDWQVMASEHRWRFVGVTLRFGRRHHPQSHSSASTAPQLADVPSERIDGAMPGVAHQGHASAGFISGSDPPPARRHGAAARSRRRPDLGPGGLASRPSVAGPPGRLTGSGRSPASRRKPSAPGRTA